MGRKDLDPIARDTVAGETISVEDEPVTEPTPWYSAFLFWRSRSMVAAGRCYYVMLVGMNPAMMHRKLAWTFGTGRKSDSDAWLWVFVGALWWVGERA